MKTHRLSLEVSWERLDNHASATLLYPYSGHARLPRPCTRGAGGHYRWKEGPRESEEALMLAKEIVVVTGELVTATAMKYLF
jgi:hypothetical protein